MSEDLIKRSDAIKDLCDISNNSDMPEDWHRGLSVAISALYRVSSTDRPQGWIPCSERLPESQGYYICTCKDGSKYKRTTVIKWSNGWQLTGSRTYWVVVAWMPLPAPWKGADDE